MYARGRMTGRSVSEVGGASGQRQAGGPLQREQGDADAQWQWTVDVWLTTLTKPVSSRALPSIVSVPATSASCSFVVVRYVQPPTVVVVRVVVVAMGLVGESLAETVTVLDGVHDRLLQVESPTSVAASVTDRSVATINVPARAQPFSSEMNLNRPVLEIE